MTEWTWEPDDFAALWFNPINERFPNPLRFTSRFAHRDDFDAHRATMRERYSPDEFEKIQLALHTLITSTIRIQIFGGTTRHENPNGGVRLYRVVGARTDQHAMSLAQATFGNTDGPIRCHLFPTDHLPAQLADCLPPCNPGTQPQSSCHPDNGTPHEHVQRLLHRPADGGGSALLYTGPVEKPNTPLAAVQWHDITDDGRYTELHDQHITVQPTTPTDLAAHFSTWIAHAIQSRLESEQDRI
ncbi:ESX secretion-associated protein EspG [Nocardia pseudovaccinii]|uniref:ESX secretion-associated protein EspG n=1 Tax=Nocardia pseudovaccinii TaxID=189540 RepID=UPI003D92D88E